MNYHCFREEHLSPLTLSLSEEVSPGGAPALKSLYCQCSVSLFFLETKRTVGDIAADTVQHLGMLSRDPFVHNIQGYEMSNKNFRNEGVTKELEEMKKVFFVGLSQ